MKKIILILYLLLLLLVPLAAAQSGHIKLLAVAEDGNSTTGSIADLYLDIKPGSGRVFIDTYPASKIDTQISTRFANAIACRYANIDCSRYDFFYTIKANTPIVGGPSAGAAIGILTISLLKKIDLNESVVITGTLNSGNIIGAVGGIKEKIEAASQHNFSKVLIPVGKSEVSLGNNTNATLNLIGYGNVLGVEVVEIGTIDEALTHFTGKKFGNGNGKIEINDDYIKTMKTLAEDLCNRSSDLQKDFSEKELNKTDYVMQTEEEAANLTKKSMEAMKGGSYYSAASFCFGANVAYTDLIMLSQNFTNEDMESLLESTDILVKNLNKNLEAFNINTITDLQAYIITKERLIEAKDYTNSSLAALEDGDMNKAVADLAFSIERINTVRSWSKFFGKKGRKFVISKQELQQSCFEKLQETTEHYQYVQLLIPGMLQESLENIERARLDMVNGDYELCLYKASLAKAQINTVLGTIGVSEENVNELVERKLAAAKNIIIEQGKNNVFPIIGYSYYEYANSLKEESKYSALLYAEYSLELSNFDFYFKKKGLGFFVDEKIIVVFIVGLLLGFGLREAVSMFLMPIRRKRRR